MKKKDIRKGIVPYLFLFVIMLTILYFFNMSNRKVNEFSYNEFMAYMENKEIKEILITPRKNAGIYEIEGKLNSYG